MKEKISAIVLGSIRHSDRHNVTNVFTRERGRMALLSPAGTSRKSRQTSARLLPLSVVEAQVSVSAGRDLSMPAAVVPIRVWRSIYADPLKSSVVMFLSEFLLRLLRDAAPEPKVWDFIVSSTGWFDAAEDPASIANFHIAFLVGMTHLMGIFPDISGYSEGMEFDMSAGRTVLPFYSTAPRTARVDALRTSMMPKILRINYANSHKFRFSGKERNELLQLMLRYFGIHFPGSDNLKSLDVLSEIFS